MLGFFRRGETFDLAELHATLTISPSPRPDETVAFTDPRQDSVPSRIESPHRNDTGLVIKPRWSSFICILLATAAGHVECLAR